MKRLICLLAVVLAAGCSSTTTESPTASSAPTTQPQGVQGKVNLKQYPFAPPDVPVQKEPQFVENQAVKGPDGEDVFYKDGEEITVYCITLGGPYPKATDPSQNDVEWYMVEAAQLVPGYLQVQFVDVTQPVRRCDSQPTI